MNKHFSFFIIFLCVAPSAVPTVHLMAATASTMSLSWLPPEKPNGIILDYEIKYHEKVSGNVSHCFEFNPISMTLAVTVSSVFSANVGNNASADMHTVAVRQVGIPNPCVCVSSSSATHPPSFYPSIPPSSLLILPSQPFPTFPLCRVLLCTPDSIPHSCPSSHPVSSLDPCIGKFL